MSVQIQSRVFIFWTILIPIISQQSTCTEITSFISFPNSADNIRNTTIVYVHDWNTRSIQKAIEAKDILLSRRDDIENVIIADWAARSQSPDFYNLAQRFTSRIAGDVLTQIRDMVDNEGKDPSLIECIGHGIGAHVCGQVGKRWNENQSSGRGKLGKIIGLNPTGPYFKEHISEQLGKGDANYVEVWHTDKRLGIYSEIGDSDLFPTSGTEIEACNFLKLLKRNQCLHNAAVDLFLRSLKENIQTTQNSTTEKIPMSILTLDVSPSMQNHGRIQNMIAASKRLIHSLPLGYFIGIIIFGGDAMITISPTNITDDYSRQRIISSLPSIETQISNTSIGAGVVKALEVIESYLVSGKYCPDIILVTDGEENKGPFLRDVQPRFKNVCTKIHTIALGDEADLGLEELSELTGGQTYFASDVDSLDKLTQSLVASSTSQFARKGMPIILPPKTVPIDVPVSFQFDEGIGNDTTFLISTANPDEVEAELTGPNGVKYGVTNYTVDTDLHQLLFKLLEVQAGNWTIKLNSGEIQPASKKRKRRAAEIEAKQKQVATVFVTTYPSDAETEPVRLDAALSGRVLDYSAETLLAIEAYLYKGDDAILGAEVEAEIFSSDGSRILLTLLDNGSGADEAKDDGIYTRYITNQLAPGKRYQVDVRAMSAIDGTTKVRAGDGDPFKLNENELSPLSYQFERQANAGSFRVSSKSSYKAHPPNPVRDLLVVHVDEETRRCSLTWTAAGKVLDNNGTVDSIQLQAFTSYTNESEGFKFNQQHVVFGGLSPGISGSIQNVTVEIPKELWEEAKLKPDSKLSLYFTVQSLNAEAGWSEVSNLAPAEFAFSNAESYAGWTSLQVLLPIVLLGIIILAVGMFIFMRKRTAFFKIENSL